MNDKPSEVRLWLAVALVVAPLAALYFVSTPVVSALAGLGVPATLAFFVVIGVGSALAIVAMLFARVVAGTASPTKDKLRLAVFIWVVMNSLFIVQVGINEGLRRTAIQDEFRWHASWLTAIAVVGWLANLARKRFAIEWPVRNSGA
jgi:uncharacterized membrane protein YGL010W